MRLDRITIDPKVCQGQPTVRGMRYTVAFVLRLIAAGHAPAEIVRLYPELEAEDIRQAAAYGAWLAGERTVPLDLASDSA